MAGSVSFIARQVSSPENLHVILEAIEKDNEGKELYWSPKGDIIIKADEIK